MALSRDARLLARVRRGDSSAFEALHARHQPAILAFCRHLTGSREDAEDAVQHTFLAAYRRIVESADEIELRPWLFAVARNRSVSLLRARRECDPADPDAAPASFDGLAVEVERRQELRDLVRDMSRLPEAQRAALVLSQLDALSYREIGSVLEVPPEKVKALVFQARSSLASTREAREAPCFEIRSEIATARGSGLRRRLLRRHVGQCDGCREFEVTVMRQRRELAILLPVAPSAGLGPAILEGALGREGATATAGAGGAAAAAGGTGSGGLAGALAVLGGGGAAKLAVVAAVVGGGATGAVAADLPERIRATAAVGGADRAGAAGAVAGPRPGGEGIAGEGRLEAADRRRRADGPGGAGGDKGSPRSNAIETASRDAGAGLPGKLAGGAAPDAELAEPDAADGGEPGSAGDDDPPGLPPGLAKRDELPHGLAKRDELPPGLAKGGGPPGKGQGHGNGGGKGNGNGGGQGNPGVGQGNGNGGAGQGNGNPAAGQGNGGSGGGQPADGDPGASQGDTAPAPTGAGPGNGGGNGNGGQGNGNAGGSGQGNGNPH